MKTAEETRSPVLRHVGWILAVVLFAGLLGFGAGLSGRNGRESAATTPSATRGRISAQGGDAPGTRDPKATWSAATIRRELLEAWRTSSDISQDWDLTEKTDRLLKAMSAEELAAFYQETDSGEGLWAMRLRQSVMRELLAKDPRIAMSVVDSGFCVNAYLIWGKRDAGAALAWLAEGALPPALEGKGEAMRFNLLLEVARTDRARAEAETAMLQGPERFRMLRALANQSADDPGNLSRVLELAASCTEEERSNIRKSVVSGLARKDPEKALAFIGELGIPASEKADFEGSMVAASADKLAAMKDWIERHPDEAVLPQGVSDALKNLLFVRNKEESSASFEWLESLPSTPQRDSFYQDATRALAGLNRFDQASGFALGISGGEARSKALRDLNTVWKGMDARAAGEWRDGLSPTDREILGD